MDIDLGRRLEPPIFAGGSWTYVLGTDGTGRDILSRILFGGRVSLYIAAASLAIGALAGTTAGLVAAYSGGKIDAILMRVADLTISFPIFLLALVMAVTWGPRDSNIIAAVAVILWARFARVLRGAGLALRRSDYIAFALVAGASPLRIITRHMLPNVANTLVVLASIQVGNVILTEAALSFLGAGVPPPAPAWGSMIATGLQYATTAWWVPTMPGLALVAAVLSLNLLGDWLRDRLDPRLRPL
jgi:peptide/nickel transport system permease protein